MIPWPRVPALKLLAPGRFALRLRGPYTRGLGRTAREVSCSSACPRTSTTTHGSTGTIWWRSRRTGSRRSRSSRPARTSTTTTRRVLADLGEHLRDTRAARALGARADHREPARRRLGPGLLAGHDRRGGAQARGRRDDRRAARGRTASGRPFWCCTSGVPLAQRPDGRDNRRDAVLRSLEAVQGAAAGLGRAAGARGHPEPDLGCRVAGDGASRRNSRPPTSASASTPAMRS